MSKKVSVFWFRRDLRLEDNAGLHYALQDEYPVLPVFIFDRNILDKLEEKADARVQFIRERVSSMDQSLREKCDSGIKTYYDTPIEAFKKILDEYEVHAVYTNRDYEPYARERDGQVSELLNGKGIPFYDFKDQVIHEPDEIKSGSGSFYKVYTPFKNSWMKLFAETQLQEYATDYSRFYKTGDHTVHTLQSMGFKASSIDIPSADINKSIIRTYDKTRNFPAVVGTSRLGIHLRHGTISIRKLAKRAADLNQTYLKELIWREFYMMILYYNPQVVDHAFKPEYDNIPWRDDTESFEKWCNGETGYPIVDAGMRELNNTGYMHNRVRMTVASFLTKHLLIDWRWGEAYFGKKLLDYELASNNGGWQWAASTGTDAQPYFRIFNPYSQTEKFDKDLKYIRKWVPEFQELTYPKPIVEHKLGRERALEAFKIGLGKM